MNNIKIHEQISFLRHQKGITQEALAKILGVTNQTVSKWEAGQCFPDVQLLPQIADYFEISVDELLGHTASSGLETCCLTLKNHFSECLEEECFDHAYRLAAQLHEIIVSFGYRKHLPWEEKNYATQSLNPWGTSACSESEGNTVRYGDLILFTDNKAWQKLKKAEVWEIVRALKLLSDEKAFKVFLAVHELTVQDFDRYVPVSEIAKAAKLDLAETELILSELPLMIMENEVEDTYRIDGAHAYLPSVLRLMRL